jgi:Family of unknown function (DUF5309)
MGTQAGTEVTYSTVGIREQLADVIYNISPTETPFMSNIGRTVAENTYFEWQTDALAAAAANAQLEGDDAPAIPNNVATVRQGNYCQISRKLLAVSGTTEKVRKAGRKSELAYQIAKHGAELKRDMEFALTQNQNAIAGALAVARQTAGIESWLVSNVVSGVGYVAPTFSGGGTSGFPTTAPTDGTQVAFTEAMLKNVAQQQFTNGGKAAMLLVDATQKQTVSGFAGIAINRYELKNEQTAVIIGAADVYVTDFGKIHVTPDRFQRHRTALLIDPEFAEVAFLRDFDLIDLATTGDAERRMLIVEYGLKVNNQAAHAKVADLS